MPVNTNEHEVDWRAWLKSKPVDRVMRLADEGLLLGAGTVLAPCGDSVRDIRLDIAEPRLLALLAAAHLHPPSALGLAHLRKAADRWRDGDDTLALIHLAHSGLDRLREPATDAKRLFLADRLLGAGFRPDVVMKALQTPSPGQATLKYDPDQPRVPAGSGRTSGQWADGDGTAAGPTTPAANAGPSARAAIESSPAKQPDATNSPTSAQTQPNGALAAPADVEVHGSPATYHVQLPLTLSSFAAPHLFDISWYTDRVKALADETEVADSIAKWRELGPRGELAIREAVLARGWILLGTQVRVWSTAGLRIEDLMVRIPRGTAGNTEAYDGFIEVKVNGGRYSDPQKIKDAIIGTVGGTLLSRVADYRIGQPIRLETGLAVVTITYTRHEYLTE
jgi:hypothetical protein